jgi:MbtH protein
VQRVRRHQSAESAALNERHNTTQKVTQMSWDSEDTTFRVVINHEEQYSIWPDYLDLPEGWSAVGKPGKKQECLDYIKANWTDMRPKSLRVHMESSGQ